MNKKYIYLSIKTIALALLVVVKLLAPSKAYACKCVPSDSVQVEAVDSEAVFTGRVTQIEPSGKRGRVKATFAVLESFKGVATKTAVVETEEDSTACGYEFRKGENYLVYAFGSGNNLKTNLCSRTAVLSQADEDLGVLRQLSPNDLNASTVVPITSDPVPRLGWPELLMGLWVVAAILGIAASAGFLIIRLLKLRKKKSVKSRRNR